MGRQKREDDYGEDEAARIKTGPISERGLQESDLGVELLRKPLLMTGSSCCRKEDFDWKENASGWKEVGRE